MHHLKSKQLSHREFILVVTMMLIFTSDKAFSDESIFFDKVYKSSVQELNLTIDLDKIYNDKTRPDFSGIWILDPSSSNNPKEILEQLNKGKKEFSRRRNSGRSGKGSRDKGRGSGKTKGNHSNKFEKVGKNNGLNEITKILVNEMEILHQEPLLRILSSQIGEQKYYTDFRSSSISAMGSNNQQVTIAGWEGNTLVIETTSSSEQRYIKKLKLLTSPYRLELITELSIQNQDIGSVQIKQIYLIKNKSDS